MIENPYLQKAQTLGVDVSNPSQVNELLAALKWCEARFGLPKGKNTNAHIAEYYGVSSEEIASWRQSPLIAVATQIVGEMFMEKLAESDLRNSVMKLFHDDTMIWLKNLSRIAAGEADKKGRPVYDKDAIAAFTALQSTKFNEGFVKMLFDTGEGDDAGIRYLQTQKKTREDSKLIVLDAIDGEVVNHDSSSELVEIPERSEAEELGGVT